ncbi:MAG: helix-hairpin-helix domain-containing protein [Deltaproteobacteria bacterium]|nr:helix-hairpin-helix domain-containing protein [Deltaproteobacteria bacterium]
MQCLALCAVVGASLSAQAVRGGAARETSRIQGVVNLNQADFDQLTLLPGVGPTKARRIVEWRAKHAFRRIEELTRVKGFGRKTFARLKSHLAVAGPTTLQRVRPPTVGAAPVTGPIVPTVNASPGARPAPPAPTRPTR